MFLSITRQALQRAFALERFVGFVRHAFAVFAMAFEAELFVDGGAVRAFGERISAEAGDGQDHRPPSGG